MPIEPPDLSPLPATTPIPEAHPALDLLQHFTQSMNIDYEKWHDGIGYDLDALRAMSPAEQNAAESLLLARNPFDWRDIEALALLDTPPARAVLQTALQSEHAEMRLAVARYAPDLVSTEQQTASLVAALETASLYRGLSQALDAIAALHPAALPPEIEDALWRCLQEREGDVAVHLAALLTYIHGQAQAPFDFALRPLFLLFHTEDAAQRAAAVTALRKRFNLPAENLS